MAKLRRGEWIYRPGLDDRCHPNVITGVPIAPEARVRITNSHVDPLRLIVWITDGTNEQSVWRRALQRD